MEGKAEVVKGVEAAVAAWIEAVKSLSVESVVALYDEEDGTLLGTVDTDADGTRHKHDRIRDYFKHFLDKDAVEPCFPDLKGNNIIE